MNFFGEVMIGIGSASLPGYLLGPHRSGHSWGEETLRININAKVAAFKEYSCIHTEPNDCKCTLPSRLVWRKYIFSELRNKEMNQENFPLLFNQACRNRNLDAHDIEEARNQNHHQANVNYKKIIKIIAITALASAALSLLGVVLIYRVF
jgi:hypothetical protein